MPVRLGCCSGVELSLHLGKSVCERWRTSDRRTKARVESSRGIGGRRRHLIERSQPFAPSFGFGWQGSNLELVARA
ncbi:MAG: hypothetical protein SW833_07130 [Cyanobacteriota bacterium]|nr:hypothetical protein [Cyanobacteriota bacterium]